MEARNRKITTPFFWMVELNDHSQVHQQNDSERPNNIPGVIGIHLLLTETIGMLDLPDSTNGVYTIGGFGPLYESKHWQLVPNIPSCTPYFFSQVQGQLSAAMKVLHQNRKWGVGYIQGDILTGIRVSADGTVESFQEGGHKIHV